MTTNEDLEQQYKQAFQVRKKALQKKCEIESMILEVRMLISQEKYKLQTNIPLKDRCCINNHQKKCKEKLILLENSLVQVKDLLRQAEAKVSGLEDKLRERNLL